MSWRNSIILCLLSFSVAACGFEPLYRSEGATIEDQKVLSDLAGIEIETQGGLLGAQFKRDLQDRLNPGKVIAANATYRLSMDLSTREEPVAVARDGSISRYNIFMETYFRLMRKKDNKLVLEGRFQRVTSYAVQANAYYSTHVSRNDAIRRAITELAEEYRQRLSAFIKQNPSPKPIQSVIQPLDPRDYERQQEIFPGTNVGPYGISQP